jgi:hypothetical protein
MTTDQLITFFEKLEGSEGCDFVENKDDVNKITWKCGGGNSKKLSISILLGMGLKDDEIEEFLVKCDKFGGHCDCEIIFNAKDHILAEAEVQKVH